MGVLNDRIKAMRMIRGYTLAYVADLLGIKEATMQRYESGEIKNIKHDTISKLAEIYGCSPAYLMGWEKQNPTFSFYLDMQLKALGYSILYDSEGNVTLYQGSDAYEITDSDVRDLRASVLSYVKFKLQEITNSSKKYPNKNDKSYLDPQAAHERTDIEVTDEMRKHDDDIMDDDNFWK